MCLVQIICSAFVDMLGCLLCFCGRFTVGLIASGRACVESLCLSEFVWVWMIRSG